MRIEEFRQTPFVSHEDKNLIYIRVGDWDLCNAYVVQAILGRETVCEKKGVCAGVFAAAAGLPRKDSLPHSYHPV